MKYSQFAISNIILNIETQTQIMNQQSGLTTNCVFFQKDGEKTVYYIPGYLRLKVKNFTSMNLQNLDAQMNGAIIFTVYYGDIPDNIAQKLAQKIILLFGRDDAIKLTQQDQELQTKVTKKSGAKQISFTIRKLFHLRIDSEVFWSPFQIINLILSITVQPVTIQKTVVKINLMDHNNRYLKLSYTEEGTFGNYDLAQNLMHTIYSNNRVYKVTRNAEEDKTINKYLSFQKKVQHFQYAHFNIPLYKYPIVALATVFLPLWLLAIVNLGIFFQTQDLASRVQSIASLMIAFVAFIPVIREQIPPNPKIVFIQILVYFQTLTSLFALIHSLDVRNTVGFSLLWYDDGLFLASFIITISTIIIVSVMMFVHYFIWSPKYNNRQNQQSKVIKFERKQWHNKSCDMYFEQVMKKKKLEILNDPLIVKKQSSFQS